VTREPFRRRITRHSSWLAFIAGVLAGAGGFVAVDAVRRRATGVPPEPLPDDAEPPVVAPAAERRPDRRLRALFLVAVVVAVAVGFTVHQLTGDSFEPAAPDSSLVGRTWVRPIDITPVLPPATTPPAPAPSPSSDPPDWITPVAGLVPRTGKVVMRRLDGDRMLVSIDDVVNTQPRTHQTLPAYPSLRPARGKRLVFVEVAVRNIGTTTFPEHLGPFRSSLSDRDGHVYQPDAGLTEAVNAGPEPAPLAPDWLLVGLLVFQVPEPVPATSFRFGPWPAVSTQSQAWSLAD
jgi:hypothetical protein